MMSFETQIVSPGPKKKSVRTAQGQILTYPKGWELVPPGDAALTRRIKTLGESWTIQQRRRGKLYSIGVVADAKRIASIRNDLEAERSTDSYSKKQEAAKLRREKQQVEYRKEFQTAVIEFLEFHPKYEELAKKLAVAVTNHATPVGSGTVARTKTISLERKVEAAVIAWLRHQTTAYDHMKIARVKGKRREVRRMLAEESRTLLDQYRNNRVEDPKKCPLQQAFDAIENETTETAKGAK